MKTILRVIVILVVASLVAGALTLAVNNTSSLSGPQGSLPAGEAGERPAFDGQPGQFPERGEHGDRDASSGHGLLEVLAVVVKIGMVTAIVLLLQKFLGLYARRGSVPASQNSA
jgi:hypothetical protein